LHSYLASCFTWRGPPKDVYVLAFAAFVPLFLIERETRDKKGYFWLVFIAMLVFNALLTWWVWNADPVGAIVMLILNSLLMCLPFMLYRRSIKSFGQNKAFIAFIAYWLAFEYLHLNWDITWPWLSLGNVFAKHNYAVQWYEYTGMLGGSLWVLLVNVFLFKLFIKTSKKSIIGVSALIILPIVFGFLLRLKYIDPSIKKIGYETIIVQPNVDPYKDKFTRGQEVNTLRKMLLMAEQEITEQTSYVIMPETAVVEYIDEDHIDEHQSIRLIKDFVKRHPQIHLITGVSTYNFYEEGQKVDATARKTREGEFYESYNTSMEFDAEGGVNFYHKSKLVPGVEKMPYPAIFGFLEYFSLDMGGISGSLGSDDSATVFRAGDKPDLAPLICYESVFPDVVRRFGQQGANLILVMTNDGWWRDTDGYKQHMYYACLRAIENRQEVIRSANTGISCHIDRTGKIVEETQWWVPAILKVRIASYQAETYYASHGDYIGKIGSFFAVFFILSLFVKSRVKNI